MQAWGWTNCVGALFQLSFHVFTMINMKWKPQLPRTIQFMSIIHYYRNSVAFSYNNGHAGSVLYLNFSSPGPVLVLLGLGRCYNDILCGIRSRSHHLVWVQSSTRSVHSFDQMTPSRIRGPGRAHFYWRVTRCSIVKAYCTIAKSNHDTESRTYITVRM